ncbi:receptor-type tyrosine-protein phosphatase F-like [Dermacentor variabilis]|uniref:receptor-type tyrosine-protein phosphatase F-like n=1 Tax=Dermacentor variabilis TaxID=34621 RepID=UPI003F5B475E
MPVSMHQAVLLCAALTAVASYEEKDIKCTGEGNIVPSINICNGVDDCYRRDRYSNRYGYYEESEDEDRELCAQKHLLHEVRLTSLAHPNGSLLLSWAWTVAPSSELAGYYLRGTSSDHTFQTTLSPLLSDYTADCLRGYTEYSIRLRPFYNIDGLSKLGKATQLIARTPATAPGAPMNIVRHSPSSIKHDGSRQLAITILGPASWNSSPVGFRLRWEPNEQSNESARDFDLSPDAMGRKKDLNVILSLKPGREYTLFASARGVGDFGDVLIGPETSVTMETTPLAPANLSAKSIDPTSVIIAWQAESPARRFVIYRSFDARLRTCAVQHCPYDDNLYTDDRYSFGGTRLETSTVVLDGSSQEWSSYSLPLFNLLSSVNYTVEVKACGAEVCSTETSTTFITPPSAIPTPMIITILSNDTSSLYLEWNITFLRHAPELNPEFEVAVKANGFYRLVHTVEKAIKIGNLSSGTEYEVQVLLSLERTPGKREYGRPARATVTTWLLVPLAPTLSTRGFQSTPDIAAVSWRFLNSTVTHVEVATNYSNWVNCENSTECDEVVLHGWNSSFKAGYVRISNLRPHTTYSLSVRGCNNLGCGDANTVVITTDMSEPSEPTRLTVNATEDGSSAHLEWKAPDEPRGPLTGYVVSWQCDQDHLMAATTDQSFYAIPGLPAGAQECSFSVSAFNVATDERQLRGKSATLMMPWPPQN